MQTITTIGFDIATPEPSIHGTFETCRDVRLESVMGSKADISLRHRFVSTPEHIECQATENRWHAFETTLSNDNY